MLHTVPHYETDNHTVVLPRPLLGVILLAQKRIWHVSQSLALQNASVSPNWITRNGHITMANTKTDKHSCCWAFLNRPLHIGFPEARSERRTSRMPLNHKALKSYLLSKLVVICSCSCTMCTNTYLFPVTLCTFVQETAANQPWFAQLLISLQCSTQLEPSSKACLSNILGLLE